MQPVSYVHVKYVYVQNTFNRCHNVLCFHMWNVYFNIILCEIVFILHLWCGKHILKCVAWFYKCLYIWYMISHVCLLCKFFITCSKCIVCCTCYLTCLAYTIVMFHMMFMLFFAPKSRFTCANHAYTFKYNLAYFTFEKYFFYIRIFINTFLM